MTTYVSTSCPTDAELRQLLSDDASAAPHGMSQHLNDCETCRQRIEGLLETEELSARDVVQPSEPWMGGLLDAIAAEPPELSGSSAVTPLLPTFPESPSNPASLGRLQEFEILRHIGSGATGHVYEAQDTRLNRRVALKFLRRELTASPDDVARFHREAAAIARISSDHIIAVYDVREWPDVGPFLVMEFVDGHSLRNAIAETEQPMTIRQGVQTCVDLLAGLEDAHAAGVVHRDIKPGNILVRSDGRKIGLVDFGLARLDDSQTHLTVDGMLAGTPAYMAPEQVLDPHQANERSDVYSVGIVLYELLTGETPFRGSTRNILHQVLHDEPRPLRELVDQIPRDLQTVCLKAIARTSKDRYASAADFRLDLQHWLNDEPVMARPIGAYGRWLRWRRRNPVAARFLTAVCLMVAGLVVVWANATWEIASARQSLQDQNERLREAVAQMEQSNSVAAAERNRAEREALRARQQSALAIDVLNRMTYGLQDTLADYPKLQQKTLNQTIADLKRMAASTENESGVSATISVALVRLADAAVKQGRHDQAEQALAEAGLINSQLSSEDTASLRAHVWHQLVLADLQAASGEEDAAEKTLRETRTIVVGDTESELQHAMALAASRIVNVNPKAEDTGQLLDAAVRELTECAEAIDVAEVWRDLASVYLQRANHRRESPSATNDAFAAADILADAERIPETAESLEKLISIVQFLQDLSASKPNERVEALRNVVSARVANFDPGSDRTSSITARWEEIRTRSGP